MTLGPLVSILVSHKTPREAALLYRPFPSPPWGQAVAVSAVEHVARIRPFTSSALLSFPWVRNFVLASKFLADARPEADGPERATGAGRSTVFSLNTSCTFQRHLLSFSLYASLIFQYRFSIIYSFSRRVCVPLSYRNVPFSLSSALCVIRAAGWHKQMRKDDIKNLLFWKAYLCYFFLFLSLLQPQF